MTSNKKIVFGLIAALIIAIAAYAVMTWLPQESEVTTIPPDVSHEELRVSTNPRMGLESWKWGEVASGLTLEVIDRSTRNPLMAVFENGQKLGEFAGLEVFKPLPSSDGSKAVIRSISTCGAGCIDPEVYIVDSSAKTVSRVSPARSNHEYTGTDDAVYEIGSIAWANNSTLRIVGYFANQSSEGYFRVSPQEVWNYNVTTRSYSFVETLPE